MARGVWDAPEGLVIACARRGMHACTTVELSLLSYWSILVFVCIKPCYRRNILKMIGSFFIHLAPMVFRALESTEMGLGLKTYLKGRDSCGLSGQYGESSWRNTLSWFEARRDAEIPEWLGRWEGTTEWQNQPRACLDEQDRGHSRGAK